MEGGLVERPGPPSVRVPRRTRHVPQVAGPPPAAPARPPPARRGGVMTNPAQHHRPPSRKQLAFLRRLAAERGRSFAYPRTSAEASKEIRRLRGGPKLSRADRRREDKSVRDAMAGRGDSARVREDELAGWGSACRWSREVADDEEDKR